MAKKAKLKVWLITIVAIIFLVVVTGLFVFAHKTVKAQLIVNEGDVQVDYGRGYEPVRDNIILEEKNKVKTGDDGKATIILFESEIVRLEPNTEVEVSVLILRKNKIKQESGITWTKINRLAGVEEFEIETPNTVATVRGTGFRTAIIDPETTEILVGKGKVDVLNKLSKIKQEVNEKEKYKSFKEKLEREDLSDEDLDFLEKAEIDDVNDLKKVRMLLVKKDRILSRIVARYKEEEVKEFFDDLDAGKIDENEVLARIPYKTPTMKKIIMINHKIREKQSK